MALSAVCTTAELGAQSLERAEKLVKHLQVLSNLQVWTHKRNCVGAEEKNFSLYACAIRGLSKKFV
jgi:hypothetical protein